MDNKDALCTWSSSALMRSMDSVIKYVREWKLDPDCARLIGEKELLAMEMQVLAQPPQDSHRNACNG